MARIGSELAQAVRRELFAAREGAGSHESAVGRAQLLDDLVQVVYDHVKQWVPSGGFDGRDSEERASVGNVLGAAHDHLHGVISARRNVTAVRPRRRPRPARGRYAADAVLLRPVPVEAVLAAGIRLA